MPHSEHVGNFLRYLSDTRRPLKVWSVVWFGSSFSFVCAIICT